MLTIILFIIFGCVVVLVYNLVPTLTETAIALNERQAKKNLSQADLYLQDKDIQKAYRVSIISPIVLGAAAFIFFPEQFRIPGTVAGIVMGFVMPRMYVNNMIRSRKSKFNEQLVNALMIMSSSFRGGLSLIQSFESVVEEMPDPIKREFGIVLGENKMGVSVEDALNRLYKRMPSIALQQMITAIILARETGGNLPIIFSRIVTTMRERRKVEQNLKMLTMQGKIQSGVMTLLPVFFVFVVSGNNPRFFDSMLNSDLGKTLLVVAGFLWVTGAFFIWKISKPNSL